MNNPMNAEALFSDLIDFFNALPGKSEVLGDPWQVQQNPLHLHDGPPSYLDQVVSPELQPGNDART